MTVFLLVIALFMFVGLVVVHELGHFFAAKRNGVKVLEFGIGFPPRIWHRKTKGKYIFSINLLPLGGFVRLKGEHDADTESGDFGAASTFVKVKIMVAGVFMNLLTAFVLLTIIAWLGMPKLIESQFTIASDTKVIANKVLVNYVEPNSPASNIGLMVNDQLFSIGKVGSAPVELSGSNNLPKITGSLAGEKVNVEYKRSSVTFNKITTLRSKKVVLASEKTNKPIGYLGISDQAFVLQRSTWSAPVVALGLIKQFTILTLKGLGALVTGIAGGHAKQATEQVAGPIGIFFILKNGSQLGFQFILMIIAIISLTLAIMNILPIPALDGGRLFSILLARLFGRRLSARTEDMINGTGFLALMVLIVLISIVDVKRFF